MGQHVLEVSLREYLQSLLWPAVAGVLGAFIVLDLWILDPSVTPRKEAGTSSYHEAVARATPSVVNIYTAKLVNTRRNPALNDPLLRRFLGPAAGRQRIERSLGSGVILSDEGHIITNNHVIADADAIQVLLHDGRSAGAIVVGSDPATDLAVLKIDLPQLSPATLGDSNEARVGDIVLAIGNPYGFGHSVSQGIISGLGRSGLQLSDYEDYIQTDASIYLGNSGGALIDTRGQLVGINTLIYTASGDRSGTSGIGINLATPINLAQFVMQDLIDFGTVVRGWLGVSVELLQTNGTMGEIDQALIVSGLAEDGPAARAGLQSGDIITAINGNRVDDGRVTMHQIAQLRPGEQINIQVQRGESIAQLSAIVGSRPNP